MSLRILIEPSDYLLENAGDAAMLRVGLSRLRAQWPDALIEVFCESPERFPPWVSGVRPIGVRGRNAWLHRPLLRDWLPRHTPHRMRSSVVSLERYLRRSQPRMARSLLVLRSDRREEDASDLDAFLNAVAQADLVVTTGMGGLTDAFAPYARALLQVLDLAQARGAMTAMMGQGIGPLDDERLRDQAAAVLRRLDLIALRERRTGLLLLRRLGLDANRVIVTGDDAIELAYAARPLEPGTALGINLRAAAYAGVEASLVDRLQPTFRQLTEALGTSPLPIAISSVAGEQDQLTAQRILRPGGTPGSSLAVDPFETIAKCRVVVAGSYHAAVFALSMGIPAIGLYRSAYYRDKFLGLTDMFGDGSWALSLEAPEFESVLLETARAAWRRADELRPVLLAAAVSQIAEGRAAYDRLTRLVDARRAARTA
jgi:polysaccharide pyruvyl transferase WcaK-like protein